MFQIIKNKQILENERMIKLIAVLVRRCKDNVDRLRSSKILVLLEELKSSPGTQGKIKMKIREIIECVNNFE